MEKTSIIIIHYGDIVPTINCLKTISKSFLSHVIIVNNSRDCISDNIYPIFENVKIYNVKNKGYASALNFGIKKALKLKSKYIFCCNNDVIFSKDYFLNIIKELEDRKLQIISPQIFNKDKTVWFQGGKIDQMRFSGDHKKGHVDYLTGCCLLFKSEVFKTVGLFDESYFMYYEDVDYFLRCKKYGIQFGISNNLKIIHDSKSNSSKTASYFLEKNRLKILFKYASLSTKMRELFRLPKTIYEHLKSGNFSGLRGVRDFFLNIFVLFCSFEILAFSSFSFRVFAEYRFNPNNPLLSPTAPYESRGVFSPSIIVKDNIYYMWYTSENETQRTISLANSSDGINWVHNAYNPVLYPDTNNTHICEKNVHDPEVIFNYSLNKFQMWYVANCEPTYQTGRPRYWIKYAESINGINWDTRAIPVLSPEAAWEMEGLANVTVWQDNYLYRMIYIGRNTSGVWKFGSASSVDGLSWTKSPDNPNFYPTEPWELNNIGTPDIVKWQGVYSLYYHAATFLENKYIVYATSLNGVDWSKPDDNPVFTLPINESGPIGPEAIYVDNKRMLYYSSVRDGKYSISLYEEYSPSPSPTIIPTQIPTSTPIPTNTPSPTPTPTPNPTVAPTQMPTNIPTPTPILTLSPTPETADNKVIFVPGLFGSWNKEAILHNKKSEQKDWKINPIINEHKGIVETFKKLGYVENQNFYVFAYDWRKNVESIADDLDIYINSKTNGSEKVKILSYSLGGLVSRIYSQKYGLSKVDVLLTVASPHFGTSKVYKPVESGEIDQDNSWQWMAEKTILSLNRSYFDSDKKTIEKVFPVLHDLLPVFNYLENDTGNFINYSDMVIKNTYLQNYNNSFSTSSNFKSFSGEKVNTSFGYVVAPRSESDKIFDIYPDGRPISETKKMGDYIVTSMSEDIGNNIKTAFDHGEIIYKKDALKNILNALNISYVDDQIVEGSGTKLDNSIMVLIKSPATMELTLGDKKYLENDGMIFVENADFGQYDLKIIGNDYGDYTVIVGKNYSDKSDWSEIKGLINTDPPTSQIDSYLVDYQAPNQIWTSPTPCLTLEVRQGQSDNVNIISGVETPKCEKKTPAAIPRISSVIPGDQSATLVWDKYLDENFDHFVIAYGTEPGKYNYGVPYISDKNTTVYLIEKLTNGQKYYFVVKAVNDCAPGEFSNEMATIPNTIEIKSYLLDEEENVLGVASYESEIKPLEVVNNLKIAKPTEIVTTDDKLDDRRMILLFSVFIMLSGGYVIYSIISKIKTNEGDDLTDE